MNNFDGWKNAQTKRLNAYMTANEEPRWQARAEQMITKFIHDESPAAAANTEFARELKERFDNGFDAINRGDTDQLIIDVMDEFLGAVDYSDLARGWLDEAFDNLGGSVYQERMAS